MIGHLLGDDDLKTIISVNILGIPLQVETVVCQEADRKTIGIGRGGSAMDEGVDTGGSGPVNEQPHLNYAILVWVTNATDWSNYKSNWSE